jgi:hypothetical protein
MSLTTRVRALERVVKPPGACDGCGYAFMAPVRTRLTFAERRTTGWWVCNDVVPANQIAKVTLVRLAAVTHGFDQNQRYLELASNVAGFMTLSVTAPPKGQPVPRAAPSCGRRRVPTALIYAPPYEKS